MARHSHRFVEDYKGLVGFGFNRETDEKTVKVYLQKFSDDRVLESLIERLSEEELGELFGLISRLLRNHLNESEYHRLFLKDEHQND